MFDIGLFELLVVGGVGLIVIGPERLPGAIRTGALWLGRIKRSVLETRREIEQSIGADEIRRELRNEEIMASLEKLKEARAQLEQDIKQHASGNTLEHHTDADEKPAFEENYNEYSDGHHHKHNQDHTDSDEHHAQVVSADVEARADEPVEQAPSPSPSADDKPAKQ